MPSPGCTACRRSRWTSSSPIPAYESLEKHRAIGTTTRLKHSKASSNDWFKIFPNARFARAVPEVYRVLKPDTHFYLFCDAETMFVAKPEAEQAGFKFWKPLVWDKRTIGMGYHYRARYELILFFEKGKRRLNDLGVADVIAVAADPRRLSGGEAGGGVGGAGRPELGAGRGGGRSVHGLGQRRRGGAAAAAGGSSATTSIRKPCSLPASGCASSGTGACRRSAASRSASPTCWRCCGLAAMTGSRIRHLVAAYVARGSASAGSRSIARSRSARPSSARTGASTCSASATRPEGLRHRVQVPGQPGHGRREDPVRARRPAGAADGRLHRLRRAGLLGRRPAHAAASPHAAYCLPIGEQATNADTRELDHLLAVHFGWWDVLVENKPPVVVGEARQPTLLEDEQPV